jgi:hypothetical protein
MPPALAMGISGASATSPASMDAELDISALSAKSLPRVHAFFNQFQSLLNTTLPCANSRLLFLA